MKKTFYTEAAYFIGIIVLAVGTALMELADFGMSMVVAPAYLLHLKLSQYFSFFSFGMAEYVFQAVLIIALILISRKVKRAYFFSFVTAVFYGFVLDGAMLVLSGASSELFAVRVGFYIAGMLLCSAGVSLLFNTYISPEAYELFVKELAARINMPISRFKTIYDCASCVVAVVLSFVFFGFGNFEGVKLGTVICALLNGWLIGKASAVYHRFFEFRDRFPLRKFFEE